jgi:hypothetical protein
MTAAKKPKNDLDSFRNQYDKSVIVPAAIQRGLKELGDTWEKEADFIRRTRVGAIDFARFRDQFLDYVVVVREAGKDSKRVWCGTRGFAQKCREAADGQG